MPAFEPRQRMRIGGHLLIFRPQSADSNPATLLIHVYVGKTRRPQPAVELSRLKRHKGALDVLHAMPPTIRNLKCHEYPIWPQHTPNFRKGSVLQLLGTQVM